MENALRLLNLFTVEKPEYQVIEIAEQLDIAPSTAHRLLTTLSLEGFIVKDSLTNKYRLGISIRALEAGITRAKDLVDLSQKIIEENVRQTKLTTALAIIYRNSTFYLNSLETDHPAFNKMIYTGKQYPFDQTSAGIILLLSKTSLDNSVITHHKYHEQLETLGYVQHDLSDEVATIAVPIKNKRMRTIAALEMIGNNKQIEANIETLITSGAILSNQIKF